MSPVLIGCTRSIRVIMKKNRNRIVLAEAHSFHLILMVSFIKPDFRLFVLAFIGTSN